MTNWPDDMKTKHMRQSEHDARWRKNHEAVAWLTSHGVSFSDAVNTMWWQMCDNSIDVLCGLSDEKINRTLSFDKSAAKRCISVRDQAIAARKIQAVNP